MGRQPLRRAVVVIAGVGDLAACDGVFGVQIAVLEVLIGDAVEAVGAADDRGVELAAGGVTEVRRELVDDEGELTDGIVGDIDQWTGDALVVVVDTFNRVVVGPGTKTADGGAGANAEAAAGGNARDDRETLSTPFRWRRLGRFFISSDSKEDSSCVVVVSMVRRHPLRPERCWPSRRPAEPDGPWKLHSGSPRIS